MTTFKELGLNDTLCALLEKKGFTKPTEIQEKAIPSILKGHDVIGASATGSGKTLAFSASLLENLKPKNTVQALILTPTRELAEQVAQAIQEFSQNRLRVLAVYGGVDIEKQIAKLRNTDVVVGTPGRVLDHLGRITLDLGNIQYLVLDEVDRMFDMGFYPDVERILTQIPKNRQTMLFSATISEDMDHLARLYTNKPLSVSVESYVDHSQLKQVFYDVPDGLKFSLLVHLLKEEKSDLAMVFCATRQNVDFVTTNLQRQNIGAQAIHGGLTQQKRNKVLDDFHQKGITILISTDVAARGLDIEGVSHVYNYDLPKNAKEYIHRIGRTARAGKNGKVINILASRDYENFSDIQRDEKLKIEQVKTPYIEKIPFATKREQRPSRFPQRGFTTKNNHHERREKGSDKRPRRERPGEHTHSFQRSKPKGSRRNARSNKRGSSRGRR